MAVNQLESTADFKTGAIINRIFGLLALIGAIEMFRGTLYGKPKQAKSFLFCK